MNSAEKTLTPSNVGRLQRQWQVTLAGTVDSSPVELPGVHTSIGTLDLLFVTTTSGSILAIDASTGQQVWRQDTHGPGITNSSPVIDPSYRFVYSYGLDGKVHKFAAGSGSEVTNGGWPATITLMPSVEKGSSALNITNKYLYATISGYIGDGGHYEGHIVAVNLSNGVITLFNALCSNIRHLLNDVPTDANYCPDIQAGIWARAGAVVDPVTGNVFVATGNGPYNANSGGFDYGDSVLELSADLTHLVDTYTPGNYSDLQSMDADLGSAAPLLLPKQQGGLTPYLALQAGKDQQLRLLNRQNLSGRGGPGHVGGELQTIRLPQGCAVLTQPVAWHDTSNTTWVFVANDCGLSAFKVVTNASGHSMLQPAYQNNNGGSSPFIANGILFVQGSRVLRAMEPTTGTVLWSSDQPSAGGSIGELHWQSPIVVNGHIYVADMSGSLSAYELAHS
ncbi:MAG: PQQ-binding-like beta-propeller repeat protein [Ktedonobacteraceae bacterium]